MFLTLKRIKEKCLLKNICYYLIKPSFRFLFLHCPNSVISVLCILGFDKNPFVHNISQISREIDHDGSHCANLDSRKSNIVGGLMMMRLSWKNAQ